MSAPYNWLIRHRMAAQKNPVRYGIFGGVISGVLFGPFMALALFITAPHDTAPSVGYLAGVAVIGGIIFGVCMGVFAGWMNRSVLQGTPLPSDTRPGEIRAAQRLVRSGQPGQDAQQNELARIQAERALAAPWWPKTCGTVFFLGAALNAWVLLSQEPGAAQFWFSLFGIALFALLGLVVMPLGARQRRRAQDFLARTCPQQTMNEQGDRPDQAE